MMMAEVGCYYKAKGMSVYEGLQELYKKYGYFIEKTESNVFEGYDAQDKMKAVMSRIREDQPEVIGLPVAKLTDYMTDVPGFTKSNVLFYDLEGGCAVAIRPSGTEPKVKIYEMARGSNAEEAQANLESIRESVNKLFEG